MRIVAKRALLDFIRNHARAEQALLSWHAEAVKAAWQTPQDIRNDYASASFVGRNRVVFNIKGNDFRLVAALNYPAGVLAIRFFGTHAEYDKIDAEAV